MGHYAEINLLFKKANVLRALIERDTRVSIAFKLP